MDIDEAIRMAHKIYKELTFKNFQSKLGPSSYDLFAKHNFNIINFYRRINDDSQPKFWEMIVNTGYGDLTLIRKMYAYLSIIYRNIDKLPSHLAKICADYNNNIPLFLGYLPDRDIQQIIDWAKVTITPEELEIAQTSNIMLFSDPAEKYKRAEEKVQEPDIIRHRHAPSAVAQTNTPLPVSKPRQAIVIRDIKRVSGITDVKGVVARAMKQIDTTQIRPDNTRRTMHVSQELRQTKKIGVQTTEDSKRLYLQQLRERQEESVRNNPQLHHPLLGIGVNKTRRGSNTRIR